MNTEHRIGLLAVVLGEYEIKSQGLVGNRIGGVWQFSPEDLIMFEKIKFGYLAVIWRKRGMR